MKKLLLVGMGLGCLAALAQEVRFAPNVQPAPVQMTVESNTMVRLDREMTIRITCRRDADAAAEWAEKHLAQWFRATKRNWFSGANVPRVLANEHADGTVAGGDEAYELLATPMGIEIRANALAGVRYALYSLRQTTLAMPRTGRTVEYYVMPAMVVKDAPALAFRGIHIPWSLDDSPTEIEKRIRLAAYLKYNYAVVEPWGAFRSARHPWWGWKEGTMTPAAVKHLVKVGKDVGITLCPQIPAFGHASMGITSPGKHAVLDAHPEYQPLFEGLNGWNWCLSNPEALKVQFEIIDEMIALFDHPPYFHVGCDEAAKPNCPVCLASDYRKLVIGHILALHAGLKERGLKMMLWHDMFLKEGDARWKGFYANGTEETVKAFETFPRDMVICDWFYGKTPKDGKYPSLEHFKEMGFEVVTCPWYEKDGTASQGKRARELGLLGILSTTWGQGTGKEKGRYVANMFVPAACAGWGSPYLSSNLWKWNYDLDFIRSLRQVEWDMGLEDYEDTGTYQDQVPVKAK